MFGFGKPRHREVTPRQLETMLRDGRALVVDVREPDEFAAGHIPGAVNMPLSLFRASQLPDPGDKTLVLNCAAGRRLGHGTRQMWRGAGRNRHPSGRRLRGLAGGRAAG